MLSVAPSLVFPSVPGFFRACCYTAGHGDQYGYAGPGWHLMHHVDGLTPWTCDEQEWEAEIEQLAELIDKQDDVAVLDWFVAHFPNCMALVPKRRRECFLKGVYQNAEER